MSQAKIQRNKKLVNLRNKNPKKWSWGALAKEFNIARPTAYMIWKNGQKTHS